MYQIYLFILGYQILEGGKTFDYRSIFSVKKPIAMTQTKQYRMRFKITFNLKKLLKSVEK